MTWVYVEPSRLRAGSTILDDPKIHHYLFRVLRKTTGANLVLFDGEGRYADAVITHIASATASLDCGPVTDQGARSHTIEAQVAVVKNDRMEWCVQKLTELGVTSISLVRTERSVVRLDSARTQKRLGRLLEIARGAAAQSHQPWVPVISGPLALKDLPADPTATSLVLSPAQAASPWPKVTKKVRVIIGPEGGFTDDEVAQLCEREYHPVGLGPTILRAETAAVAAAAVVGHLQRQS